MVFRFLYQKINKHSMKKILITLLGTILLWPAISMAQNEPKTGYTNIEYILSKIDETKKISDVLDNRRKEYETAYQSKVKELQDKVAAYQKGAATMPDIIKKDKEKELENLQKSLQEFQQSADGDIQNLQSSLLQPLYTKVYKAIQDVAEENKYQFIFNTGNGNQVRHILVAPTDGDISEIVIKKLQTASKATATTAKTQEKAQTSTAVVAEKAKPAAKKASAPAKAATKKPAPKKK
jgi:outer membrane protein